MSEHLLVDSQTRSLTWSGGTVDCSLGKGGVRPAADKREGDGATPLGCYPLRWLYYRPDRLDRPVTGLAVEALTPDAGWCDAADAPTYNQPVRHPCPVSAEQLWRADGLYDLIVVLGHNDRPVIPGLGSAIFLHCSKVDDAGALKPTLGCIAVPRPTLLAIVAGCDTGSTLEIR